jgi:SHS2 domain-containing protein
MRTARWEHFPHEADMGVRGFGATAERAFEQAAIAMTAVITDPGKVSAEQSVPIHCEAPDPELLLVDWLNALIYEMATRKLLFSRFEVRLTQNVLDALAWGERLDPRKHGPGVEIKGATYTALRVERTNGEWVAQCVVDV